MDRKNNKRSLAPILMIGLGAALIIILFIWFLASNTSQTTPTSTGEETLDPNLVRVSLVDAKAAYDGKTAVFVDVRAEDSYAAKHIPGAINIPLGVLQNQTFKLNPNQWIITYCT
jgi:3-mercaptopyruvate sulfurtransferase SseA